MPVHDEVLATARRLCRERGGWTFSPDEVVRALPHLNANTVRTHIVSRCCVNAPANHLHRWGYFRRVARGTYEILPAHRRGARVRRGAQTRVAEAAGRYGLRAAAPPRDTVHAIVTRSRGWYVAECLEVAVVTQGHTLDELVTNLREAVELHLEGGDAPRNGVVESPRIALTYEIAPRRA